jgi:hypothetical protein
MNEYTQAEVQYEITHDFVLDVYEQSLYEDDPEKKAAIVEAARELSKSIGDYLVSPDIETDE